MLSAALLLGEMVLLNRVGHEAGAWRQLFGIELPPPTPSGVPIKERELPQAFIAASALLLGLIVTSLTIPRPTEIVPSRISFVEFPMIFGRWHGRPESLEAVYTDQLKLDDYVLADYSDEAGDVLNLYVAYYNSQRKGGAVHSPRSCLPGGGWQMKEFDQRDVPGVKIGGRPLRVNRTLIELGDRRQLVYYWFQQRGRLITNEYAVKWYLFRDALTRHRTDGALVRMTAPLSPGGSVEDADHRLADLASKVVPELPRFVPD
jgi:EpsI family protein